jgi:hypothetical protein
MRRDREQLAELERRLGEAERRLGDLEAAASLDASERALSLREEADDLRVSVILPTHDRPRELQRAIGSVLTQLHRNLELVVVDTKGADGTLAQLEGLTDDRMRTVAAHGARSGPARNAGQDAATGELISYLDDDNVMAPWWLRALALTARAHPEDQVFYGARIHEGTDEWLARVQYVPWFDRERLRRENYIDTSTLAHRLGVGRWPEDSQAPDWELVAGLVASGHVPRAVPARAVVYMVSAEARTSSTSDFAAAEAAVARLLG